jgi:hypothetical protein
MIRDSMKKCNEKKGKSKFFKKKRMDKKISSKVDDL